MMGITVEMARMYPLPMPVAFKPYLDQKFMFRWCEAGMACFAANHPNEKNMTHLECMFELEKPLAESLIYRKRGIYFDEIKYFKNAEFRTRSLIPGDKNLQRAYWSNSYAEQV